MKSTIFKSLFFTSLLALAVGCGKDGGGGGSSNGVGMNPVIDPNLNQNGQQALANLKAWYANSSESSGLLHRGFYRKETTGSSSGGFQFTGSFCIGNWGINCGSQTTSPTNCYVRNGDGVNYDIGTPASNGVTCTVSQSKVTKAANNDLTRAVNGNGMILLSVQQQGNTYQLIYGVSNGYQVIPKAAYTIDTNYHSLLNPIIIEENNSRTVVKNLQVFQF